MIHSIEKDLLLYSSSHIAFDGTLIFSLLHLDDRRMPLC